MFLHGAQSNLYQFEKLHPNTHVFKQSLVIDIQGILDINALRKAIIATARRHDALRSNFVTLEGTPQQFINPTLENGLADNCPFFVIDARHLPITPALDLPLTLKNANAATILEDSFNLETDYLWRIALVQFSESHFQFLLLAHHLIIDETSIGILFNDISAFYNETPLPALPPIAADLQLNPVDEDREQRIDYWKNELSHLNIPKLPIDVSDEPPYQFKGRHFRFQLPSTLNESLTKTFSKEKINNIMLTALVILLNRYTNESDFCIGVTSKNRRHPHQIDAHLLENHMVNCYFNTMPVRIPFEQAVCFSDLLQQIKQKIANAAKHQLPLDQVVQECIANTTLANLRNGVPYPTLLKTYEGKPSLTLKNTEATHPLELDLGTSKFTHFGLSLDKHPAGHYECFIEYNTDFYTEASVARLAKHFENILRVAANTPNIPIALMPMLSDAEQTQILTYNIAKERSREKTVLAALKNATNPQAVKMFHDDGTVSQFSYQALEAQSTQLANYLLGLNLPHGAHVGLCLGRSYDTLVASFAIMKAGLVFVPIENNKNNLTPELIQLKCQTVSVVITHKDLADYFDKPTITLDDSNTRAAISNCDDAHYPPIVFNATDAVYLIYTSGTTSKPKGVLLTHEGYNNLLNALCDWAEEFNMPTGMGIYCSALPTFDAFYYDVLVALSTQGTLYLTSDEKRFDITFVEPIIANEKIAFLTALPDFIDSLNPNLPIRFLVTMGAAAHASTLKRWLNTLIFNGLGHTETGICLSQLLFNLEHNLPYLGRAIPNMEMYIVHSDTLTLCAPGVSGEMIIAGPGVALGYTNQPELSDKKFKTLKFDATMQRFIPCASTDPEAKRFYFTSDIAAYKIVDNELVLLMQGRNDRQIKINGVRIEMDWIENTLRTHPDVNEVVIMPNSQQSGLIAYTVPTVTAREWSSRQFRNNILKHFTHSTLPGIAFPQEVYLIDDVPLTPNGKVDWKILQTLTSNETEIDIEPSNPGALYQPLAELWAEILGISSQQLDGDTPLWSLGVNSMRSAAFQRKINNHPTLKFSAPLTQFILRCHEVSLNEMTDNLINYLDERNSKLINPLAGGADRRNTIPRLMPH